MLLISSFKFLFTIHLVAGKQLKNNSGVIPRVVFIYSNNIDSVSCAWSRLERSNDPIISTIKELPFKTVWIGDTILATINKRARLKKQKKNNLKE